MRENRPAGICIARGNISINETRGTDFDAPVGGEPSFQRVE